MKTFTGTKTVNARPMNRLDYNTLRGWPLPADENGADEGYLVEYTDGGKPNHPDFAGYISWSPKEQFDRAYREHAQATDATGTAAPRVTVADLEENIVHTDILKYVSHGGQILRWAIITTKSGFAVTGRPSAAVSAANDDPKMGEKIAFDNAKQELWPLMGYALKNELARPVLTMADAAADLAGIPRPS